MARIGWVEASPEIVRAFQEGITFGLMVGRRRPIRVPLWTEDEWREALIRAGGKPLAAEAAKPAAASK